MSKQFNSEWFQQYENRNKASRAVPKPIVCHEPEMNEYTPEEDSKILTFYRERKGMPVDLDELASLLGRPMMLVAIRASRLAVCEATRPKSDAAKSSMSVAQKKRAARPHESEKRSDDTRAWIKSNGHPKGMLGKKHSQSTKDAVSTSNSGQAVPRESVMRGLKTKVMRYGNLVPNRVRGTWKSAWREIGGKRKFYRSKWEANYARYLEFQKINGMIKEWSHEPQTFWFEGIRRGCVSYLPDFKVITLNGLEEFHEVKGWMDAASKTKIKRMAKYHPKVILKVLDAKWYQANKRNLSGLIKDWE